MTMLLWKLHDVCAESSSGPTLEGALTQHLMYTPTGLTSVLVQIGGEQAAYVLASGCRGCVHDQCVPGCRMELLRRVIKASHPASSLTLVRRGLLARPYARAVMAWPTAAAHALDADLLTGWSHARLLQHWRGGGRGQSTAVLLVTSADGDDPRERLRTRGWIACPLRWRDGWFDRLVIEAVRRLTRRCLAQPYLVLPAGSAVRRSPRSARSRTVVSETDDAVAHDHAATIAAYVQAAGGRLELLDLQSDERTARLTVMPTADNDIATLWRTLASEADGLEVRRATQSVVLDPAYPAFPGQWPPLLLLGTRPDGAQRWRPIDATHHLVISGTIDGGTIAGMLGAAAERRADLHIGVVDLTARGRLAAELTALPGWLATTDSGDAYELLHAITSIADSQQPVLAIVHAEDASSAERTALMLLRAALDRDVSVLLVVPTVADIPAMLKGRCPHLQMHDDAAQWQMVDNSWDRYGPVVLRPPWREFQQQAAAVPTQHARPLLAPVDGFWAMPAEFAELSATATDTASADGATMSAAAPDRTDASIQAVPLPPVPAGRSFRSRIYTRPVPSPEQAAAVVDRRVSSSSAAVVDRRVSSSAAASELEERGDIQTHSTDDASSQWHSNDAGMGIDEPPMTNHCAVTQALPAPSTHQGNVAYQPREDRAGQLVIEPALLALALVWAETADPDNSGVSITRFRSGVGLPSKAHSLQLCQALRDHGLIREALKREGWFRLLTVAEAVAAGSLPAGPWSTPSSVLKPDSAATAIAAVSDQVSVATVVNQGASVAEVMR